MPTSWLTFPGWSASGSVAHAACHPDRQESSMGGSWRAWETGEGEGGKGDAETRTVSETTNGDIVVAEGVGLKENRVF